jgi:hypothetical protein
VPLLVFAGTVGLVPIAAVVLRPTSAPRLVAETFLVTLAITALVWLTWAALVIDVGEWVPLAAGILLGALLTVLIEFARGQCERHQRRADWSKDFSGKPCLICNTSSSLYRVYRTG